MAIRRLLLLALAVTPLYAPPPGVFDWHPPAKLPCPGAIRGTVTGEPPLVGRTVVLTQVTRGAARRELTVDEHARIEAFNLQSAQYQLTMDGLLVGAAELTAATPYATLELAAPDVPQYSGTVTDAVTGRPIPGALVMGDPPTRKQDRYHWEIPPGAAYEWVNHSTAELAQFAREAKLPVTRTDAEGRYTLPYAGAVLVIAPDRGLFPGLAAAVSDQPLPGPRDFELWSVRQAMLRGRITLPDGSPYANGKATIQRLEVTTDADGRYAVMPEQGIWTTVECQVEGYAPMHFHLHGPHQDVHHEPLPEFDWPLRQPDGTMLVVEPRRPVGRRPLPPDFKVRVRRLPTPADVAAHQPPSLHYEEHCGAEHYESDVPLTDGLGRLALPPGQYQLLAQLQTITGRTGSSYHDRHWFGVYYTNNFAVGTSSEAWRQAIVIEPGIENLIDMLEPPVGAMSVTMLGPDGQPEPHAGIKIARWDPEHQRYYGSGENIVTDTTGTALLDPMVAGTYVLVPGRGDGRWQQTAEVLAGRITKVTLRLNAAAAPRQQDAGVDVTGMVLQPDGQTPAAFAAVYLSRTDNLTQSHSPRVFTDVDGRFNFKDYLPHSASLAAQGDGSAMTTVPIQAGTMRLVLQRGAGVSGRVDTGDRPLPSDLAIAWLPVQPYDMLNQADAQATPPRADGTFTLSHATPGHGYLALYRGTLLQPASVRELDLPDGGTVTGQVLPVDEPSPGVTFRFLDPDGQPVASPPKFALYNDYGPATNCGGCPYESGPLPPGRYHLWVGDWDYLQDTRGSLATPPGLLLRDLEVRAGRAATIEVTLPAAGGIAGRVVHADGTPAADYEVAVDVPGPFPDICFDDRAFIALLRTELASFSRTWTGPDGTFRLYSLAPGRYQVAVRHDYDGPTLTVSEPVLVTAEVMSSAGELRLR